MITHSDENSKGCDPPWIHYGNVTTANVQQVITAVDLRLGTDSSSYTLEACTCDTCHAARGRFKYSFAQTALHTHWRHALVIPAMRLGDDSNFPFTCTFLGALLFDC